MERRKAELYRVYVTDAMKSIVESLGNRVEMRYAEAIEPRKVDTRTAEEIVSHISDKLEAFGETE